MEFRYQQLIIVVAFENVKCYWSPLLQTILYSWQFFMQLSTNRNSSEVEQNQATPYVLLLYHLLQLLTSYFQKIMKLEKLKFCFISCALKDTVDEDVLPVLSNAWLETTYHKHHPTAGSRPDIKLSVQPWHLSIHCYGETSSKVATETPVLSGVFLDIHVHQVSFLWLFLKITAFPLKIWLCSVFIFNAQALKLNFRTF